MTGTMNAPVPLMRSTPQAEALVETVRSAYGLDVTGCTLLKPQLSDTYRVDSTSGPYILRVYPYGLNLSRWVIAEEEILNALRAGGIPVSTPVPRANGEWLLPIAAPEGERCGVLFTYAHGRSLKHSGDAGHIHAFGQVTARMHLAAGAMAGKLPRAVLDAYTLLARPMDLIRAAYPDRSADVEELCEITKQARAVMDALPQRPPVWGFCHGDLNFSNVHVTANGALTLFDFEYCGPGWPAYDIATVFNFERGEPARTFLEGYESVRPLRADERAALGWFQIANRIWMLGMAVSLSGTFGSLVTSIDLFDDVLAAVRAQAEGLEHNNGKRY